ncbi:hypothetical protein [Orenia marismortui]|uniref:hypothetical protein n=1 Tax=Orenia marismortui TaxID=46469 RepID=UPI0003648F66|nr:hypothetical protein [Orenia marismortui]
MKIKWDMFLFNILSRLSNTREQIMIMWNDKPDINEENLNLPSEIEYQKSVFLEYEKNQRDIAINNSLVAFAWSNIEITLIHLCKNIAKRDGEVLSSNFARRDRLKEIRNYLRKKDFCISDSLYNILKELETVRNCVVHAAGYIYFSNNKEKLENITKTRNWLKITDNIDEFEQVILVDINYLTEDIIYKIEKWLEKILINKGYGPRFPILK